MFKIFKYKKLYEKEHEDKIKLLNDITNTKKECSEEISAFKKKIEELESAVSVANKRADDLDTELTCVNILLDDANKQLDEKEEARHKNACKVGGLTKENHKLINEKKEMLDFIGKLLTERKKYIKDKKHPTLEELKKYFRIKY
ncbi:MAG: hypothetical protein IJV31_08185 [Clostridia bacterium]|nr:hypothetical protein [Clostridia bacterium]